MAYRAYFSMFSGAASSLYLLETSPTSGGTTPPLPLPRPVLFLTIINWNAKHSLIIWQIFVDKVGQDGGYGVSRRQGQASVRRMYSARIHGSNSIMTAAVYQGDGAEEVRSDAK
jgi:hypothetical protein